jgi:RecB family exonuclease
LGKRLFCGNIVHSVLENVVSRDKPLDQEEIKTEYEKHKASYDPEKKISEQLVSVGETILNEFFDENPAATFNVFDKEYEFKFIIGNYLLIGYIDRIDLYEDEVVIIDYKTGKWEVSQKELPNNLQLGIYALAASLAFPDKKITAELYYLRSGRHKRHTFTPEDLENVKLNIINSIKQIVNDTSFSPTSNGRICSYCEHAKTGACPTRCIQK